VTIQERIEETAFAMLGMPPEQRERLFVEAFDLTLAEHPDLTEIPPAVIAYTAAVMRRIAELEQQVGNA
jgi:hypothetical protein